MVKTNIDEMRIVENLTYQFINLTKGQPRFFHYFLQLILRLTPLTSAAKGKGKLVIVSNK